MNIDDTRKERLSRLRNDLLSNMTYLKSDDDDDGDDGVWNKRIKE